MKTSKKYDVKRTRIYTISVAALAATIVLTWQSHAQTQPAESPPAATSPDEAAPSKSLDDLLGIEDEKDADSSAADTAARESQEELDRELNETKIADGFASAVEKMSLSADLLDTQFDSGLGTQRVQEDILAKLSQIIDQAKKSKSKSSSSSSSSSQQQQAKNQQQKTQPGQQQNKANTPGQERNDDPSDSQEGDAPPMQEGDINTVLEESRTEWGALPQRVRDALIQGKRDKYSRLYNQLTAEYYKRLAEENAP